MRYIGIDPSTKTGFVVLDKDGEVIEQQEIAPKGTDPARMIALIQLVTNAIRFHQPSSAICIEGFGFSSQQAVQMGGIGWGIRMALFQMGLNYHEVAPTTLKKFTGAGGNAAKEQVAVEVYKRWGFQNISNNITDAFVLAQMARSIHELTPLTNFQQEALQTVLMKPNKKTKAKRG